MNRAEKNAAKREMQKIMKTISKLSPQQVKVIEIASKERAQVIASKYVSEVKQIIEDCTCSVLYDAGLNALEIMNKINILMIEESLYIEKEGIEVDKKLTREMIVESAKKHGLSQEGRRKIAKELKSTYSTISTYVSRWKITEEELKKQVVKVQVEEDPEVNKAAEQILEIIEGEDTVKKIDVNEDEVINELANAIKEAGWTEIVSNKEIVTEEEVKEKAPVVEKVNEPSKLKVLTMTLKGENGTYRACENGVELTEMGSIISFESIGQVDEWANEVKQVFERLKV